MRINLDELYERSKKEGLIQEPTSSVSTETPSGKVDLDSLYEQSKKEGLIDSKISPRITQSKPNLGMVEKMAMPLLNRLFPGGQMLPGAKEPTMSFSQARQSFEEQAPGMIERRRQMGQVGQSVMLGAGTGALLQGAKIPQVAKLAAEGAVAAQPFSYKDIPSRLTGTGIGASTNVILGKGAEFVGKKFFKRQIAQKELTEGAGKRLQEAEEKLHSLYDTNPEEYSVKASEILPDLEKKFTKIADKKGSAGTALRTWIKILKDKGDGTLSPSELLEARQRLGSAASFSKEKGGSFVRTEISNEATSKLAKEYTNIFSDSIKKLAKKAGIKSFELDSKVVSNILRRYPEFDPTKGRGDFFERGYISTALGMSLKNPVAAAAIYEALKIAGSPEGKNALFKLIQKQGIKTGATIGRRVASGLASNLGTSTQ